MTWYDEVATRSSHQICLTLTILTVLVHKSTKARRNPHKSGAFQWNSRHCILNYYSAGLECDFFAVDSYLFYSLLLCAIQ